MGEIKGQVTQILPSEEKVAKEYDASLQQTDETFKLKVRPEKIAEAKEVLRQAEILNKDDKMEIILTEEEKNSLNEKIRKKIEEEKKKNPVGRPTKYTYELAEKICRYIITGERGDTIKKICSNDDMPSRSIVWDWIAKYEEFSDLYTRAREKQADRYFDDIIDIADDSALDMIRDAQGGERSNSAAIQRSQLMITERLRKMSQLKPKKYDSKYNPLHDRKKLKNFKGEAEEKLTSIDNYIHDGTICLEEAKTLYSLLNCQILVNEKTVLEKRLETIETLLVDNK